MNGLPLLTVLVAVGSAEANRVVAGKPMVASPVIGGFILGIFLFTFMSINAQLTSKFCYLIIVSALIVNGDGLFKSLSGNKPKTKKTTLKGTTA